MKLNKKTPNEQQGRTCQKLPLANRTRFLKFTQPDDLIDHSATRGVSFEQSGQRGRTSRGARSSCQRSRREFFHSCHFKGAHPCSHRPLCMQICVRRTAFRPAWPWPYEQSKLSCVKIAFAAASQISLPLFTLLSCK